MRAIETIKRLSAKAGECVALLCLLMICGCSSGNDEMPDNPANSDWNDADISIFLNGEYVGNASATFAFHSDSDSADMVLTGINPTENIELKVATSVYDKDGISFKGEQNVEDMRIIKVEGLYRPRPFYGGTSQKSMIKINVSYSVPNEITSRDITIPFEENYGFCYPMKVSLNQIFEDSCDYICKNINAELGRHLKSATFRFDENGKLAFSYVSADSKETKHTFRYWISLETEPNTRNKIINVAEGDRFYECLLNALTPPENRIVGNLLFLPHHDVAKLYVDDNIRQFVPSSSVITVLDELQYNIFPYFLSTLMTDRFWSEDEKRYLNCAREIAQVTFESPFGLTRSYSWALRYPR